MQHHALLVVVFYLTIAGFSFVFCHLGSIEVARVREIYPLMRSISTKMAYIIIKLDTHKNLHSQHVRTAGCFTSV